MFSNKLKRKNYIKYLLKIFKQVFFLIARYEYKKANLTLKALTDFLNGPEFFVNQDALDLHQYLVNNKIIYYSPEEVGVSLENIVKRRHNNFLVAGILQFLYNFFPSKDTILYVNGRYFNNPYRVKRLYIYDDLLDKGYILERNRKEFFKILFSCSKIIWALFLHYNSLLQDWQKAKPILTSLPFWEKYLKLKNKEIIWGK